jgi:hypothetical protein
MVREVIRGDITRMCQELFEGFSVSSYKSTQPCLMVLMTREMASILARLTKAVTASLYAGLPARPR